MIEFAPNPSGSAHIGTLRTYAAAWLLAQQRKEKLFVRFDAHNLVSAAPRHFKWAVQFLDELKRLCLSPDAWDYLDKPIRIGGIPEWARIERIPWGHDQNGIPIANGPLTDVAYYPEPVELQRLPASEPRLYEAGTPEPICMEHSPCWGYFAVYDHEFWGLDESLVSLQQMDFRGVSTIVRSSLSVFIRSYLEVPAGKYFGYCVPETVKCDVVCDGHGALSKHSTRAAGPGTVAYSIARIGPKELRTRILTQAQKAPTGIGLDWREVVGHD